MLLQKSFEKVDCVIRYLDCIPIIFSFSWRGCNPLNPLLGSCSASHGSTATPSTVCLVHFQLLMAALQPPQPSPWCMFSLSWQRCNPLNRLLGAFSASHGSAATPSTVCLVHFQPLMAALQPPQPSAWCIFSLSWQRCNPLNRLLGAFSASHGSAATPSTVCLVHFQPLMAALQPPQPSPWFMFSLSWQRCNPLNRLLGACSASHGSAATPSTVCLVHVQPLMAVLQPLNRLLGAFSASHGSAATPSTVCLVHFQPLMAALQPPQPSPWFMFSLSWQRCNPLNCLLGACSASHGSAATPSTLSLVHVQPLMAALQPPQPSAWCMFSLSWQRCNPLNPLLGSCSASHGSAATSSTLSLVHFQPLMAALQPPQPSPWFMFSLSWQRCNPLNPLLGAFSASHGSAATPSTLSLVHVQPLMAALQPPQLSPWFMFSLSWQRCNPLNCLLGAFSASHGSAATPSTLSLAHVQPLMAVLQPPQLSPWCIFSLSWQRCNPLNPLLGSCSASHGSAATPSTVSLVHFQPLMAALQPPQPSPWFCH